MCLILQCPCPLAHHVLGTLHKMCISRAAFSSAHAERTCSQALLSTLEQAHQTPRSSRSPPMRRHTGEKGRERETEIQKSEPNPSCACMHARARTHTQARQKLERAERRSHFLYSPANVIDVGVCISGCVCHADSSGMC